MLSHRIIAAYEKIPALHVLFSKVLLLLKDNVDFCNLTILWSIILTHYLKGSVSKYLYNTYVS